MSGANRSQKGCVSIIEAVWIDALPRNIQITINQSTY